MTSSFTKSSAFQDHPTATLLVDGSLTKIISVNKKASLLFGKKKSTWQTQTLGELLPGLNQKKENQELLLTATGGQKLFSLNYSKFKISNKYFYLVGISPMEETTLEHYKKVDKEYDSLKNDLIKTSIDAFISTNEEQIITGWNSAAERVFGWTSNEVIGRRLTDVIIPPHYRERHTHGFNHYLNSGESSILNKLIETTALHKNGNEFPVELIVTDVHNNGNHSFYSFIRDISARKNSENKLKQSEANLSEALLFGKMGSVELDLQTFQITVSKELFQLLEVSVDKPQVLHLEHFFEKYIAPDFLPMVKQKLQEGMTGPAGEKRMVKVEFEMITASGRKIWIEATGIFKDGSAFGILHEVTERKMAKADLVRGNELLKRLSDNVPGVIFKYRRIDEDNGQFVFVSNGCEKLLGLTSEQIKMHGFRQIIYADDLHAMDAVMRVRYKDSKPISVEFKVRMPDGTPKWIACESVNYLEEDGSRCWYGFMHDMTERKLAELRIAESELKNRLIIENSGEGIIFASHDGKVFTANPEACRIFGMSEAEICFLGRNGLVDLSDRNLDVLIKQREKEGFYSGEVRLRRKDGSIFTAEVTSRAFVNQQGELNTTIIFHDITDRKNAEEEVKKLALIARGTSNLVIFTDCEGKITWVNESFERVTEYSFQEAIGKKPGSFLQGPKTDQSVIEQMRACVAAGTSLTVEVLNYSKSGKEYWLNIDIKPIRNENDKLIGFMAIELDITALKEAMLLAVQTAQRLVRSENDLRAMLNASTDSTVFIDLEGRIRLINKVGLERLIRFYKGTAILGEKFVDLLPQHLQIDFQNYFNRALHGEVVDVDKKISLGTGATWIRAIYLPVFDKNGLILGVSQNVTDITNRKLAELALEESENDLRAMLNASTDSTVFTDRDGRVRVINKMGIERVARYFKGNAILGKRFVDLLPPQYQEDYLTQFNRALAGEVVKFERNLTLNNKSIWTMATYLPVFDNMGNIIGVSQNIADITEQKEAEKNLHFTKFTIDRSSDPIFWITPDGSIAEFNPAACASLGYADEEMTFLKMSDVDTMYSEREWRLQWEELRLKKNINFYRTHRKKDGTLIDVEINANYIEFEGMEYNCAFVRDITERKKSEAALLASNREKDFLIKEIHHRIKNNLQLISSIVYLRLKTFKQRDIRVFLEELRQKIKSISVLHERLLQTEELDSVYIDHYLERVLRDIHVSFYRPDLMVDIKTDILPIQIRSETATYCGLIVNELLTNAIKHAFPRDSKGEVWVRLTLEEDGNFKLSVRDNGIGLPDTVSPEENASFGMSLIYIFVQQLGGEFTIIRNNGTDFQIRFAPKTIEHEWHSLTFFNEKRV